MTINRNNYEDFFLLYVDNELSATEKNVVEIFLQNNPDLQEEMTMLQQSIIKPGREIFENKQSLRREEVIITWADEQLLLLLDSEAKDENKIAIEKLITDNASVKAAWDIFQQTKLASDEVIIFTDKQSLYRKENTRVITMPLRKMAVAAAFIGFVLLAGITYFKSNSKINSTETAANKSAKKIMIIKNDNPTVSTESISTAVKGPLVANTQIQKKIKQTERSNTTVPGNIDAAQTNKNESNTVASVKSQKNKPSNNLPKPYFENLNSPERNTKDLAIVSPEPMYHKTLPAAINFDKIKNEELINKDNAVSSTVAAAFREERTEEKNQLLFDEAENKKGRTRMGGFLKKMKRVFERKTNTGSNDNNIRVANMSFAVQ